MIEVTLFSYFQMFLVLIHLNKYSNLMSYSHPADQFWGGGGRKNWGVGTPLLPVSLTIQSIKPVLSWNCEHILSGGYVFVSAIGSFYGIPWLRMVISLPSMCSDISVLMDKLLTGAVKIW